MSFRAPVLLSTLVLFAYPLLAQGPYWGMTSSGGSFGVGTIYTITESNVFTTKHNFLRFDGSTPKGDVVKASNGLYYGVTEVGGTGGVGVLFSFNPSNGTYTVLHNFNSSTTGAQPLRGPVIANNGRLYGTCSSGGANNVGTLWEYNIGTSTLTKKFDFDGLTTGKGSTPRGRLMVHSNGTIYGTTQLGGLNGAGCIFSYTAGGVSNTKVYNFPALPAITTGNRPLTGLAQSGSLLYGFTANGGANGHGSIFSFNTSGNVFTNLYNFLATGAGRAPLSEFTAVSGVLYATASAGGSSSGGTIFSWDISGAAHADLVHLNNSIGYAPFSRLFAASDGQLYGTTSAGGTSNAGVLFSFNTGTNTYTPVLQMASLGLSAPWSSVIEDPSGTLVGMASDGGTGNEGALFKYTISGSVGTVLLPFSYANGANPHGRLFKASNGLFYGLASAGGEFSSGTLFSIDPTNSNFITRVHFDNGKGTIPLGSLVEDNGKLYGVCSAGGTANGGTLFEYNISSNILSVKVNFASTLVGNAPVNGLFKATNGLMYGATGAGAGNAQGSLYEYVPGGTTLTKRKDFLLATTGKQPLGDVMQASDGLLYGTTSLGGAENYGTIFSFDPVSNTFTTIYNFNGLEGGTPGGELLQATNGKLYGVFREEGQGFSGGIYSWDIGTATYTEEFDLNIAPVTDQGSLPQSSLLQGSDGMLYGTTTQGGSGGNASGAIFRFDPTSLAYSVLLTFTGASNGALPYDGLVPESAVIPQSVGLAAKVFLEGPFVSGTGLMNANLRSLPSFPLTEPFSALGFTQVGGGGETIAPSVLATSGNNAVVDWVLVELRNAATPATLVRTQAALLQSDGDIVGLDNNSTLTLPVPAGTYHVAIRHRNHLGVMTGTAVALSSSPTSLDLTTGLVGTYGTNALKTVGAYRVLRTGNSFRNTNIKYTGSQNDRDPILIRVGSITPNNTANGYFQEDVNLNGQVKYTGSANDRDPILLNVGSIAPNNTVTEQLP